MQFPESWLREFCNPPISTEALADLLTMAGLEVEEMRTVAPPFDRVVVASVVEVARHPNADRLNVCQVDAGTGTLLNIVCGAPNVRAGIKVPCALVGAKLSEAGAADLTYPDKNRPAAGPARGQAAGCAGAPERPRTRSWLGAAANQRMQLRVRTECSA